MANLTANYGWTKPVVGGDGDAWGAELNTDLDGIDSTVKSVSNAIPAASSTAPAMNGTAAVGIGTTWARADHVHPTDTSLLPLAGGAMTGAVALAGVSSAPTATVGTNTTQIATTAFVAAAVPLASSTPPIMDGTAVVGTGTTWARADHSHPSDASRAPIASPTFTGIVTIPAGASISGYALLASPTFTGTPSMPPGTTGVTQAVGDNSTALATTAFVSALPVAMNDNRIINGDMRIDQRNNGASGTANNTYTIDRWYYSGSQASKFTWGRNLNAVVSPAAFPYYFGFRSSSAYTPVATDNFYIFQAIEADVVNDLAWGTPSAQSITLSFWAYSQKSGTFGGVITNNGSTRSYPFTFQLPNSNTWTFNTVTIPGDTAGTWLMSGNSVGLYVVFDLGCGTNGRGPAGTWAAAGYFGATGAVSVVSFNGATFYVTGVKLEVGSIATPFNRQSLAKSLADCQRYYQTYSNAMFGGYLISAGAWFMYTFVFPVVMRATPTLALTGTGNTNCTGPGSQTINSGLAQLYVQATAAGNTSSIFNMTASAEL